MTSIWHRRATEEKSVHQLLDCLYDAAIHDDRWIDFCRETTQWLGGISMNLNCQTSSGFEYVATHRMPPEFSTIYPLHFLEIDPWVRAGLKILRPMQSACSSELCLPAQLERSEFYTDFITKFSDIYWMIGAYVPLAPGETAILALHRHRHSEEFGQEQKAKLDWLLPHIRRALMIRNELRLQRRTASSITAALDSVSTPLIILDARSRVVHINRAADESLRRRSHGLWLGARQVEAADPTTSNQIHAEIKHACEDIARSDARVVQQSIPRRVAPVLLVISPLTIPDQPRLALLTVIDFAARHGILQQGLSALGLTRAERRLAMGLADGADLKAFADQHGLALATVRTQLQQILQKTDLHSQTALMRLTEAIRRSAPTPSR
jgi:DNA-binding CsgD family transcriptional regulator